MADQRKELRKLEGWLVRPALTDDLRIQLRIAAADLPDEVLEASGVFAKGFDCPSMNHCGELTAGPRDCTNLRSCGKYKEVI